VLPGPGRDSFCSLVTVEQLYFSGSKPGQTFISVSFRYSATKSRRAARLTGLRKGVTSRRLNARRLRLGIRNQVRPNIVQ
jgi:hypothetical protein